MNKNITITRLDHKRLRTFFTNHQNSFELKNNIKTVVDKLEVKPVDPKKIAPTVVTMNSKIKLRNLRLGQTFTFQLVYPDAVDILKNKISIFSPIGASMLGYSQGDEISMTGRNGKIKFVIEQVLYQPEAAGDFHL